MKNKKISTRKITLICIVLMVLMLFFTGYSFGKGFAETQVEALGKIAKPILIVDNNEMLNITSLDKQSNYEFIVRNYNDNR